MENKLPLGKISNDLTEFQKSLDNPNSRTYASPYISKLHSILKLVEYWKDDKFRKILKDAAEKEKNG